jgi:hypothetical protein
MVLELFKIEGCRFQTKVKTKLLKNLGGQEACWAKRDSAGHPSSASRCGREEKMGTGWGPRLSACAKTRKGIWLAVGFKEDQTTNIVSSLQNMEADGNPSRERWRL